MDPCMGSNSHPMMESPRSIRAWPPMPAPSMGAKVVVTRRHGISDIFSGRSILGAGIGGQARIDRGASFDSQGISHAARYGPVAASMPSQFGLESPPPQRLLLGDMGYRTSSAGDPYLEPASEARPVSIVGIPS
jgi:hypothetical protein